jgi:hypothetical protein
MVWGVLVALGVAIVSMTVFGARLTKRAQDGIVESLEDDLDPNDPWAAWKPRPFEEHEKRPRPRVWPVLASLAGLVFVGAGFAGARQTPADSETTLAAPVLPTPKALTVDVEVTPPPTPTPLPPTPRPVIRTAPTSAPSASAPTTAAASSAGPTISGSPSCSAGKLTLSYSAAAKGSPLAWLAVYIDGAIAKGGPVQGSAINGSVSKQATPGTHALELSVEDKAGQTSRKQFQTTCS